MYLDMIEELQKVDMAFLSLKSTSMLLDTRQGKESLNEEVKCFLHFNSKLAATLLSKSAILFFVLLTTATMLVVDLFLPSIAAGLMLKENNTVCAEIFAVLNFRGCITLRIFADFIFAVVDRIKFIIIQFKMFELESFIRGFMFNMYRERLSKERYFIALAKSRIEKIPTL